MALFGIISVDSPGRWNDRQILQCWKPGSTVLFYLEASILNLLLLHLLPLTPRFADSPKAKPHVCSVCRSVGGCQEPLIATADESSTGPGRE